MDDYLQRLIAMEKNMDAPGALPSEPTEAPSVGSVGTPTSVRGNITRTWWQVYRDGALLCIIMAPTGLTHAEALRSAQGRWPAHRIRVVDPQTGPSGPGGAL